LAALDLIEQTASYALLKGYFKDVLAMVLYQWNRLEEARSRLRTVIQDAATWQQSDLLLSGYIRLMQVELARGDLSAVQQALQEFEQYEAFPVVMRVYFAELRWTEAMELLGHFSGGLDRPTDIRITLTYLAQYMV